MDKRLSSTSNWKIGWLRLLFPEKCNVHAHEVVLLNQALDLVVNLEKSDLMYRRLLRIYCNIVNYTFFFLQSRLKDCLKDCLASLQVGRFTANKRQ